MGKTDLNKFPRGSLFKLKYRGWGKLKKVLILEDNPNTREYIKALVNEIDIKTLVFTFGQITDAYACTLEKDIDLFIIDVILDTRKPGDSSGLRFIDSIRRIERYAFTPVIFVTSLEDSRLYSYEELHCYRFFEKPFDSKELQEEIRHCLNFSRVKQEKKKLYFRKEGIVLSINQEDIVYVEIRNHLLQIHFKNGELLNIPYITLKRFLGEADSRDFIQCSRSAVINLNYLSNIDFTNGIICLNEGTQSVEIGIIYKKKMREIFK